MSKVTVIIPCYNQGGFLEETVNSVLAQSFSDWEIIIVNDGSTDDQTNNFLKNYNPPKTTVFFTDNKGVSAARNFAILRSSGEYILPLDADDIISKNYLREAVEILDRDNDLQIVYANGEYFGDLNGPIDLPPYDPKKMLQQNLIFNSAFFRKYAWSNCLGYDEAFLTGWEDWDFWLRLINNKKQVYKLPGTHYYYRIKKQSRNAALQNERLQQAEQQLYSKHIELYRKFYPKPISLIRNYEYLLYEQQQYEDYKISLHNSLSYRIGNFILSPVKYLKRFKKSSK